MLMLNKVLKNILKTNEVIIDISNDDYNKISNIIKIFKKKYKKSLELINKTSSEILLQWIIMQKL